MAGKRAVRIVGAARTLLGVPFRWQGRSETGGVDCVGLVALALSGAGLGGVAVPRAYGWRGGRMREVVAGMRAAGLTPAAEARMGDILLVEAGPVQLHLMIAVGVGRASAHIHAHAGLGRVVEMPGESPWPVLGRWRA